MTLTQNIREINKRLDEEIELKERKELERKKVALEKEEKKTALQNEQKYLEKEFTNYLLEFGSQAVYYFHHLEVKAQIWKDIIENNTITYVEVQKTNKQIKVKENGTCEELFDKKEVTRTECKYVDDLETFFNNNYYKILSKVQKEVQLHEQSEFLQEGIQEANSVPERKKKDNALSGLELGLTITACIVFFPIGLLLLLILSVCKYSK